MASSIIVPAMAATGGRTALVSGASFAGLTTAILLRQLGYQVTVVEVAPALRNGGTPVDIEGETVATLTRIGLMDAVRAKALPPRAFEFREADDTPLPAIGPPEDDEGAGRFEIHRDDLVDILAGALAGKAELLFGRSIAALEQGSDAVSVTLSDGTRRSFALVFGCDGNRSNTRKLAFGADDRFSHFMGCYLYLKVVPQTGMLTANTSEVFSIPGHMSMLNGYSDRTDIGFGFRTDQEIDYDYRDKAQQRRLVRERFEGLTWKVPAMLAQVDQDGDFYFDRITQIRMPSWSHGRVALVGDAGYCVSPFAGLGGSMAIIGAGRLAEALASHPDDHATAFHAYEQGLRPFVTAVQNRAEGDVLQMMLPADDADIAERNRKLATGEFWSDHDV